MGRWPTSLLLISLAALGLGTIFTGASAIATLLLCGAFSAVAGLCIVLMRAVAPARDIRGPARSASLHASAKVRSARAPSSKPAECAVQTAGTVRLRT